MANLFPKWTNHLPTIAAAAVVLGAPALVAFVYFYIGPSNTDVGYAPKQPVRYSHKLHAGLLGMDCRYCHSTVEKAAFAAIPSSETCMNCHKQVKTESLLLKPVRESYDTGKPVEWVKVHLLPDFAYFNHSVHVSAGVGCSACHGRIDQMEVVWQAKPLSMRWCLNCHRNPEQYVRPLDKVKITDMTYEERPLEERIQLGSAEMKRRKQQGRPLNPPEHCSACHR